MNAKSWCILSLLGIVLLLAAGLLAQPAVERTASAAPPVARSAPLSANRVVVGMDQEPDSLYLYGSSMLAAIHVRSAIYDGPFDSVAFTYQPAILARLPSPGNGDLVLRTVTVHEGDRVVDDADSPITLTAGARVRPASCRASSCAVTYGSGPLALDQVEATFELVPGIKWADGITLTADDSVYSFELYMDPDTPTPSRYVGERTAAYVALDERHVRWTGLPGYWDLYAMTTFWTPLPRHAWSHLTAAQLVTATESSRTPLGYGPYTVQEWAPGLAITLTANPYYFRASGGLPHIPTLVFHFLGSDAQAALDQLVAGQVDVLTTDISLDSVGQQLLALEGQGLVKAHLTGDTAFEHADFGIEPVESYVRPDFFADARMRQAFAMCLNRQAVIDELHYGASVVPGTYVPPLHPLYPGDLATWSYDPAAAMVLLEQMGWTDTNDDGVRECHGCSVAGAAEGTPLAFKWMSTTATVRVRYMQMFGADLARCGFAVTLENIPASQVFAPGPDGPVFGRHFDVASFTWLTGVEPPCNLYLSDETPTTENGWSGQNCAGFSDATFDAACNAASIAMPGTEAYVAYHQAAMRIFSQQQPEVPLYLRLKIAATQPRLVGFRLDPTANSELYNVEEWDFLADGSPPAGTLRAGDGSQVVGSTQLSLYPSASDSGGGMVSRMLLREQAWDGLQWAIAGQTGWVSYTTAYSWTLGATAGAHYLSAYFLDDSGNVSPLPGQAVVNYAPASTAILSGTIHVYRVRMAAGEIFTATLHTLSGDADLYVWAPGNTGAPTAYGDNGGTALDQVEIASTLAGDYHVEVRGYAVISTYHLDLEAPPLPLSEATPPVFSYPSAKPVPPAPLTAAVPDNMPTKAPGGLPASLSLRSPLDSLGSGGRYVQLLAQVLDAQGNPVPDGTLVTVTTTLGYIAESGTPTFTVETAGGLAWATLVSGEEVGTAAVVAAAGEVEDTVTIAIYRLYYAYLPLVTRNVP